MLCLRVESLCASSPGLASLGIGLGACSAHGGRWCPWSCGQVAARFSLACVSLAKLIVQSGFSFCLLKFCDTVEGTFGLGWSNLVILQRCFTFH